MQLKKLYLWIWGNSELLFWIAALVFLGIFSQPYNHNNHFSLCLYKWMGYQNCTGCGIGHSIAFLLRADISASWNAHFMGIPASLVLVYRIIYLINTSLNFSFFCKK